MSDYTINIKENKTSAVSSGGLEDSNGQSLNMGAVGDGQFLKREGAGLIGADPPAGGADGKTVLNGTAVPTTEGVDGDFYIKTDTDEIYGPKTGGAWGSPTSLIGPAGATGPSGADGADGATGATGPAGADGADGAAGAAGADGKTVLNGTSVPTTEGVDGDFYIKTDTSDLYGPKTGGAWGAATSLIGPAGATGPSGADGADGATGTTGPAGADGADGVDGGTLQARYSGLNPDLCLVDEGTTEALTTVNAASSTDSFTKTAHGLLDSTRIFLTSWSTPETAYSLNTEYWVAVVNANEFQIRATRDGAIITGFTVPNNAVEGYYYGYPRGIGSVDLQCKRNTPDNVASGDYSSLLGGEDNQTDGDYCSVVGGTANKITSTGTLRSTIVGGSQSTITGAGDNQSILGGSSNSISAPSGDNSNSILGGGGNLISAGSNSIIGAGTSNQIAAGNAFTGGGSGNVNNSLGGVICGGYDNTAGSFYSTVIGGHTNETTERYSVASGYKAKTTIEGEKSHCCGGNLGRQSILILQKNITHSLASTWYSLRIGDNDKTITLPTDSLWTGRVTISGKSATKNFGFEILFCAKNLSGTVSVLSSSVTTIHEDDANFDAKIIPASDISGAATDVEIQVTSGASTGDTIEWSAVLDSSVI